MRKIALIAGPLAALAMIAFVDLEPGSPTVTRTAAVAVWMALWWIAEVVPLAVTALLPVVLFPLFDVMDGKTVASQYFNHIIFLFIGGFLVALAMERWHLHKRIALRVLLFFGTRPQRILLGFMAATAFLSMWISNTATAMMMLTILLAVILELEEALGADRTRRFATCLLIGVAYSASIGGIATLVGTPPNMSFTRIFEIQFPDGPEISFARWFAFAAPLSLVLLLVAWLYLSLVYVPRGDDRLRVDRRLLRRQYAELGPMGFAERVVLADFLGLVVLWLTRADIPLGGFTLPGWSRLFPHPDYINDGTVAIACAVVLFMIPARDGSGSRVMDWPAAAGLPWNIVLLFGGGFALARGFVDSGLSAWLGQQLEAAGALHPYVLLAVICLGITFLTELTSNTATAEMILPIVAGLAVAVGLNPLLLMIPTTLSCSCAFMMPVATPPNAIVFGTERLHVGEMARAGLALNFIAAALILLATYLLAGPVWGIDLHHLPAWAAAK